MGLCCSEEPTVTQRLRDICTDFPASLLQQRWGDITKLLTTTDCGTAGGVLSRETLRGFCSKLRLRLSFVLCGIVLVLIHVEELYL